MKRTILFILSLLLVSTAFATDRLVPSVYPTIQDAISAAVGGDTVIVADGEYRGTENRNIDFEGKAITVRSENGPEDCIIDCQASGRGFHFHSGEGQSSVLAGFTITNGQVSDKGGGICCEDSSPVITNCTIYDNLASCGGGGIYCNNSNPTITSCAINENSGSCYNGGGIYCDNYSCPTITDCNISGNRAYEPGGGIYCNNHSCPIITNCMISYNRAYDNEDGGGIYCEDHSCPTIINSTISRNQVGGADGGGIYCYYYSDATITNCIISENKAIGGDGGGIYCRDGSKLTLTTCIISGNRVTEWSSGGKGGGIYCYDSPAMITNCTVSANSATNQGGGIFYCGCSDQILVNCILWFNADSTGTGESAQISYDRVVPEVTYSCVRDDDPNDTYIPFCGESNHNIDDEPMFVRDPNDCGDGWGVGFNDDFGDLHLQSGSPCINAGEPDLIMGYEKDIDGQPRIFDDRIDMGADEFFIPTLVVTEPAEGDVWASGSIRKIKWSGYDEGNVDILFSKDNGSNWQTIESSAADIGSYTWYLPDIVDSNQCLISIVPSVPNANVVCIESGLFTIHPDNPDIAVAAKWKSLGGDFKRTGLSENYGPELGCVKWKFETNLPVFAGVTVSVDGRVVITCEDGSIYTLDEDGSLLWSCVIRLPVVTTKMIGPHDFLYIYEPNLPPLSSPTIGPDGTVYVGSKNKKLYAIDINGNLRWTHTTGGFIYSSPAVSADGEVYVCSQDGALYALGQDGSELWKFKTGGPGIVPSGSIFASPAIGADGTVYIAGLYDPDLYALNPDDGSLKWVCSFESGGWPFASPVVATDGTIYQTLLHDANLYAIEPNNGSIIWATNLSDTDSGWFEPYYVGFTPFIPPRYNVSDSSWSEPALGPDSTIYVSFDDPYLRAVEPNGSIKWVTRLGMMGGFTLTVGGDGLIYAASDDKELYVVNPDGKEIARFEGDDWLSFPVIAADNTIIVSDADNTVWAIGGSGCEGQIPALHRPQDLNFDRLVNNIDFALLAADWFGCTDKEIYPPETEPRCDYIGDEIYLTGDVDRSLYVDLNDLSVLVERWLSED